MQRIRLARAVTGALLIIGAACEWIAVHRGDASYTPVSVHGKVVWKGRGLGGVTVSFQQSGMSAATAVTDRNGQFMAALVDPGAYLMLLYTTPHLSSTHRQVELLAGNNDMLWELPPTELRLTITTEADRATPTAGVYLHGPAAETTWQRAGWVSKSEMTSVRLIGLGFGPYTVTSYSDDAGLVSKNPGRFTLSPSATTASITLTLVERPLRLRAKDSLGRTVATARAFSGRRSLLSPEDGVFLLDKVPGGERVTVYARGLLPACRYVQDDGERQEIVMLAPSQSSEVRFRLINTDRPMGMIGGLPGSECDIAVRHFERDDSLAGSDAGVTMTVKGLPPGQYSFRPEEQEVPIAVRVPGPEVTYVVPERCKACG
jgi:hypothetical protein